MSVIGSNALAGASGQAAGGGTGYEIERSLRFNDDDSSYLNKTFSSSGNRRTFTFSFWTKLGDLNAYRNIITASSNPGASSSSSPRTEFRWGVDGKILFATNVTGSSWNSVSTNSVFRDPSAWYHVVVAVDTTQATESNRVKIYVNGVQELWSGSPPGQNDETPYNNTYGHAIGTYANNYNDFFDGYLAEFISIDGQALAPTDFGEFDDSNVWQPKEFDGTYGTNGFHLDFSDTSSDSALGTDSSGNGNDWTVNNLSAGATAGTIGVSGDSIQFAGRGGVAGTSDITETLTVNGTQLYSGTGMASYTIPNAYLPISSWSVTGDSSSNVYVTEITVNGTRLSGGNYALGLSGVQGSFNGGLFAAASNGSVYGGQPGTISYLFSAGIEPDALRDSPSQIADQTDTGVGGEVIGNYATWNPLFGENQSLSNGNLKAASSTTGYSIIASTLAMKSGKWYMEYTYTPNNGQPYITWGISQTNRDGSQGAGVTDTTEDKGFKAWDSGFYSQSAGSNIYDYSSSVSSGDIISLAFDADAGKLWVAKNGTYMTNASGAGNPTAGTNPDYSGLNYSGGYYFMAGPYYTNGSTLEANFGQRSWAYTAPSGYKALCTANLPEPTIADGSTAFDTKLFTGNASTQSITGLNFSPSLVWTKSRSLSYSHRLYDTVRGTNNWLASNLTDEATAESETLTSFDANGFTLGQYDNGNYSNGDTAVAWAWDAGSSNTSVAAGGLNSSLYDQSQTWSSSTFFNANGNAFYSSGGSAAQLFDNVESGSGSSGDYPLPVDGGTFTLTFTQFSSASTVTVKLAGTGNALKINGSFVTIDSASDSTQTFNVSGLTSIEWLYNGGSNYCYLGSIAVDGIKLIDSGVSVPNIPSIASTVRANPTAGFSIVSYTGDATIGRTIAHGLNAVPEFIIGKNTDSSVNWSVYTKTVGAGNSLALNDSGSPSGGTGIWGNVTPTSQVFTVGGDGNMNGNGNDIIAYCFAPVEGYSAFGSYTGNGSSDGPFVYTGFRPAFILIKVYSGGTSDWHLFDTTRNTANVINLALFPNLSTSEATETANLIDAVSNGFKVRGNGNGTNNSSYSYIYAAFASNPFKTSRAR